MKLVAYKLFKGHRFFTLSSLLFKKIAATYKNPSKDRMIE